MKAMIFAAGLGTRLHPLTQSCPKALVTIGGQTLLEITVKKLIRSGFDEIIINVHHFADHIIDFLKEKNNFGIRIEISDEREQLLDTGGGLLKASWFFNSGEPFLVHNVDVLAGFRLRDLYSSHFATKSIATLAVKKRSTSRYLLFNQQGLLCGWKNNRTQEIIISRQSDDLVELAFSGIHVISPQIFERIEDKGVFSIIDVYLSLAKNNSIAAFRHDNEIFFDVGTLANLEEAGRNFTPGSF